jgi:hypothetical protein
MTHKNPDTQTTQTEAKSGSLDGATGSAFDDETRLNRIIENPALFDASQKSVGINETFGREHIDCVLRSVDEAREKRMMVIRQQLLNQRADIDRQLLKLDMALPNDPAHPRDL